MIGKISFLPLASLSALILGLLLGFIPIRVAQASPILTTPQMIIHLQEQPTQTPTPVPTLIPDLDEYTEQELEAGRPMGIIIGASALVAILFGSVILGYSLGAGSKNEKK